MGSALSLPCLSNLLTANPPRGGWGTGLYRQGLWSATSLQQYYCMGSSLRHWEETAGHFSLAAPLAQASKKNKKAGKNKRWHSETNSLWLPFNTQIRYCGADLFFSCYTSKNVGRGCKADNKEYENRHLARRGSSVRGAPPEESESGIVSAGQSFQGPVEGLDWGREKSIWSQLPTSVLVSDSYKSISAVWTPCKLNWILFLESCHVQFVPLILNGWGKKTLLI